MADEIKALAEEEDAALMVLYQAGSTLAFDVIYGRYSGKILGFFLKKNLSPAIAQDLLQDCFLKLHRSKNQYDKSYPLAPWIFAITKSVFLDFKRKKQLEDPTDVEVIENQIIGQIDLGNQPKGILDLDVLNALPETQKQVVGMRVVDEQTFEEIAQKINTTPDNARQVFSRGIRKLRTQFLRKE